METARAGDLVTVTGDGPTRDGIVFDTPSNTKVVVAVVDRRRGPLFRTVHPQALAERSEEGPDDPAIRRLLRRTPLPVHADPRAAKGRGRGAAGFGRGATHRTTGK